MKVLAALDSPDHGTLQSWYQVDEVARGAFEVRVLSSTYPIGQVIVPCRSGRYRDHRIGLRAPVDPTLAITVPALALKIGGSFIFGGPPWAQDLDPCCGFMNRIIAIEP